MNKTTLKGLALVSLFFATYGNCMTIKEVEKNKMVYVFEGFKQFYKNVKDFSPKGCTKIPSAIYDTTKQIINPYNFHKITTKKFWTQSLPDTGFKLFNGIWENPKTVVAAILFGIYLWNRKYYNAKIKVFYKTTKISFYTKMKALQDWFKKKKKEEKIEKKDKKKEEEKK